MNKPGNSFLLIVVVLLVAVVVADRFYFSTLKQTFLTIEKQRVETTNKLNTARIVYEKLNHVRDLVFNNMDFPNQTDSISHETRFFEFMTTCINDLKLKLISVKPLPPQVAGRVTTYSYEIEIEGDFFSFGELCSKLENSRRITTLNTYGVSLIDNTERTLGGPENRLVRVKMGIDTYRVKKFVEPPVAAAEKS